MTSQPARFVLGTAGVAVFAVLSAMTALASPGGCCSVHSEAGNPAFSPDGRTLVFAAEDNFGPAMLKSVDLESGAVQTLTLAGAAEAFPVWSPDGTRLAFLRGNPDTLWVMDAHGSSRRLLAASLDVFDSNGWALAPGNTPNTVLWGRPSWSPDGSTVAFTGPDRSIRLVELATGVERRLAAGDSPVFSPNGSRIAFLRESSVWTVDVDGTDEQRVDPLQPAKTYERHPAWAPDSRRLVFQREYEPLSGRPPEILVADLKTGAIIQPWRASGRDPTWSPDGERLVFADRGVEVLDLGSGELLHLTDHVGVDTEPTMAPDGGTIAFTAGRSVFLIGADGRLLRNAEKLRPDTTDPAQKPACEIGPESPFGFVCWYGGSVPFASAQTPLSLRLNHINSAHRGSKGWSVGAQIIVRDARGYRVRDAQVSVEGIQPGFIRVRTILRVTQTAGNSRFGFWSGPRLRALKRQPPTVQLRVSVEGEPIADLALHNPRYRQ